MHADIDAMGGKSKILSFRILWLSQEGGKKHWYKLAVFISQALCWIDETIKEYENRDRPVHNFMGQK